ncbi:MAG: fibronectin type III domain-containing protein, partial [Lachnospiraceae bacterium]|nr:fibronectin type III domain-containing protein [Lachnospiraceae bacterium]
MRKTIKRLVAACLIICLLPFADYSTALAAGNTGAGNMDTMEDSLSDISMEPAGDSSTDPFAVSENNAGGDGMLPEAVKADRTGESADCNMQVQAQIHKKGYVALNWQEFEEGAAGYGIYRNEQLLAETEETEFHDRELEKNATYTYKIVVLDGEGQEIAQDYSSLIEIPDSYEVSYNNPLVLKEDMVVYDLNVSGKLDLNGYSLTVLNHANLRGYSISFHSGSLLVNHDVQINCSGFEMTAEEDYLYAGGNVIWDAWAYGYYGDEGIELQKGTMEIKGDFLAGEKDTFFASEDFCTIFSGEEKQTIELYKGDVVLGRVELANTSEEGVYAKEPFVCSELIQNDTRLVVGADEVTSGFELEEDMVMDGDFCLGAGILDLAGHTLTIQGSLIQTGGTVFVNGGRLVVEGDYRIQSRIDNEDGNALAEYQYGKSVGILNMTMDGDEVLVKGGFYTDSRMDHQGFLTKGTLEVKGDFYEYADSSFGNFIATDEHKVILSGEEKQTVSFGINRASASRFSNLELQNTSEEGIVFVNRPYVAGELSGNESRIEGAVSVGSRTVYKEQYYGGDIYLIGNFAVREPLTFGGDVTVASYLTLYDRMTVEGNVTVQKNCLTFMGGELIAKQNFSVPGGSGNYGMKMTNEADRLLVYGDFYYDAAGTMSKSAGTIEVKGNVEIVKGFVAEGSHVFVLSGDGKQEVSMKEGNAFYELWVENYSEEGVHILTDIIYESIKENGCNITYFSGMLSKDETVNGDYELDAENFNLNGKTLTVKGDFVQRQGILKLNKGKLVVEGDFILSEGTVQMTGGNITVKGNLIQEGGTIQVENGNLTVEGDYRLQKRSGQEAAYSYEPGSGILQMTKEGGRVLVMGNFHTASTVDHTDYFTNGILEIKGNLVQETGGNAYNLVFSKEHLLLLSGTEKQTVSFWPVKLEKDKLYYQRMSCIANLEITNNSKEGIEFLNEPVVNGSINDNHNKITGAISIISDINIVFKNGYYGGDIALWDNSLRYQDSIHIAGDVQMHSGFYADNDIEIEGDCVVIEGSMSPESHCISIGGNLSVQNTSFGLYFSNYGKVVVGGNLDYQPGTYKEDYLKGGSLEVKGDALINGNFRSSGTQVIFSGEKKQMIYAGTALFKRLILSNSSKEGVIANMPLNYSNLDVNGCRLVYGEENDLECAVTGFTLQEDYTATGDLYLMDGEMDLNGHTLMVEGDLIQASGDMNINGGTLIVKGSYRMQYRTGLSGSYTYGNSKGRLVMTKEKDQVLVCGDFYCGTVKSMEGLLTNGTMEVRGDFRQSAAGNFIATGNHTVILGRKLDENGNAYVQTVFFEKYPGFTRFHKVVLTKLYETGYVFKNDLSSISDEILYDYCDEEAPSAVTEISVTGAGCSSITIAYEGAVDNEKILGYEIYRDGVKIGETSAKSFKDSGLKADKEYTYQVFAFDEYRNVAKDSPKCVGRTLVDEEAPEAVRGLYVKSVTGSSITIAWRKAADNVEVTGYKVYRNGKEIAATNGELMYKDTGLLEGKIYMYQVAALDESGNESELCEGIEASVIFPQIDTIYPEDGSTIGGETAKLTILYKYRSSTLENKVTIEYYDENRKEWISIASGLEGEV